VKDKPELPTIDTIVTSLGKIRCRNCRGQQKLLLCRWRRFHGRPHQQKIRLTSFIVIQVPPILS